MNRSTMHGLVNADFENLLEILTTRQHLHPHESVQAVLNRTVDELGVCPNAVEQALQWLQLDGRSPIGRVRRTELMQLARTVHRFWRQAVATPSKAPRS
jgi:hypothetical protein